MRIVSMGNIVIILFWMTFHLLKFFSNPETHKQKIIMIPTTAVKMMIISYNSFVFHFSQGNNDANNTDGNDVVAVDE